MKLSVNKKRIAAVLCAVVFPIVTFYLFECLTHNPWANMKLPAQFLNIVLFELLMIVLYFLTGRLRTALMLETAFFLIIGVANYFVLQFRSAPIMPWDIFSIKTAVSVADNFKYTLNTSTLFSILGFFILLIAEWFLCPKSAQKNWKIRTAGTFAGVLLLCGFTSFLHLDSSITRFKLYDKLFTPTVMSKRDGTAVAFLMELEYLIVEKPSGYNKQKAQEILSPYEEEPQETDQEKLPNIIVIMDEAFSDPAVLGEFRTNKDYMPFVRSLMDGAENTVSGYLNVSVLGGNTANTEFEFLTGNSMAFLPQGSVPYQQYVKKEQFSLASWLKDMGYATIGMHPYNSTGWDRNKVYPLLGLDTNYFKKDFNDWEYVRKYVSDQSNFEKIISLYEQKEEGKPLFLFNVTMQNHSAYGDPYDNFVPEISLEDTKSTILNNYLSLLYLTDTALEEMVRYFEQEEEDTVIVFFGDHQPTNSVVEPVWKLNGKSGSSLTDEELALRYKVPFFIWANYDIEEASGIETSPNYLGSKVLEAAGLPQSGYHRFLSGLEEEFPVVTAIRAVDQNGVGAPVSERMEELKTYRIVQYYQLFDWAKTAGR